MKLFLLLLSLKALCLGINCATIDDSTAQWVLGVLCTNETQKFSLTPGKNKALPPCQEQGKEKVDLTPTNIDLSVECTTRDNYPGICVLYYQCNPETKTIIDDGATIIDIRSIECSHYLEVCCRPNDVTAAPNDVTAAPIAETTTIPPPAPSNDFNFDNIDLTPDRHNEDKTNSQVPVAPKKDKKVPECGWSNPGVNIFTLRSNDAVQKSPYANYGEFPYMVALIRKSDMGEAWSQADYLGGGTLIHPSVVLTVAHKLSIRTKKLEANQLKCRAGEWDTQTTLELFEHQERDVARYIIHEDYYRTSLYNDVALLIMEKPFTLKGAPHMGTGCLASQLPPDAYNCYSMGWGKEFNEKKKYAVVLKKVQLQFVNHDRCERMLRENSRLGELFDLHESLTCANGAQGVDTCRGDGGSPLVCPVSTNPGEMRYAVYGMVAYGITCGNPLIPGVYANVPHLKSWVDQKMQEERFDNQYYTI